MLTVKSKKHLYILLGTNKEELNHILGNLDNYYAPYPKYKKNKDGTIKYKNGVAQKRDISPSLDRLKEIQKRIKNNILKQYDFPDFIQGGVRGKDNISNGETHKGNKYFFNTDLKKFFPSIKYKTVYNTFIELGFSADVSSILTKLTTYKGCIPQGIPTSTYITNLATLPLDNELLAFCKFHNIKYTRYVDDLAFSSKIDFKNFLSEILAIIKDNNLSISQRKTFYKIGPTDITGIEVRNNVLRPSKSILAKYNKTTDEIKKRSLEVYISRIT